MVKKSVKTSKKSPPARPKKAKVSKDYLLRVEVLQNGRPIAERVERLSGFRRLTIGSSLTATINAPFYPLPNRLDLFRRNKVGRLECVLNGEWSAEIFRGEDLICTEHSRRKSFIVKPGDKITLFYKDLQVLAKVVRAKKSVRPKTFKSIRAPILSLFGMNPDEKKSLFFSGLLSAVFVLGFAYVFTVIPSSSPKSFYDLPPNDIATFVDPMHFRVSPEALQSRLEIRNLVTSTVDFIKSFAAMIDGRKILNKDLLYPNSVEAYEEKVHEKEERLEKILSVRHEIEENIKGVAPAISVVFGQSYASRIFRLMDKTSLLHESLALSFEQRKQTKAEFNTDHGYEFSSYKDKEKIQEKDKSGIEKVNAFSSMSGEERLIMEVNGIAAYVEGIRNAKIEKQELDPVDLEDPELSIVVLDPRMDFARLGFDLVRYQTRDAIDDVTGVAYEGRYTDPQVQEVVDEKPKEGSVDLAQVRKIIEDRKVELEVCYELALRNNEELSAKAEVQWFITKLGKATKLEFTASNIADPRMLNCIRNRIQSWRFPRAKHADVKIVYPFQFSPR